MASRRAWAFALVVACMMPVPAQARHNVLMLFDEDVSLPGLASINRGLRDALRAELKGDIEFFSESLQVSQFTDQRYYALVGEHFKQKYEHRRPDLIVAVMEPSLEFVVRHGEAVFAGVPIVFCGADPSDLHRRTLRPNITGILVERDFAPTLDIALRLQPETSEVFIVGGTSRFDRQLQTIARAQLEPFHDRVRMTWLTEQSMEVLLKHLSELPERSVVYYLSLFADGAGRAFSPHGALSNIAKVARAPVYVSVDQFVGLGAVGGYVYSLGAHGEHAGRIGARILRGEAPAGIPVTAVGAQSNLFDWRQLDRWGLEERRLPPGSVVHFRPPSAWQLYKWHIVGGAALLLLQSALIVGLLANRAQRRRAEKENQRQRDELAHTQRVAALGELTASVAHEVNQPLTAIAANAEAARRLLASGHAQGEVEEALNDMAADAKRAAEVVHGLRALFQKRPSARAAVDVTVLIEDVLRLLANEFRRKHIGIESMPGEGLPRIVGDAIQLKQVLINLLVNAEEAILLAGEGPREIRIATSLADAAHVAIEIRDSGVGVKESDLERIFERFVSTKPQGLGMGLAISRSIVAAHGGTIRAIRNEDGRGITLRVELPVQLQSEPARFDERAGQHAK